MGTKLTPIVGLDKRIWFMTSSTLWCHSLQCILQTRIYEFYRPVCKLHVKRHHSVDDITNHLLLSRPTTSVSFNSISLSEPKILNVFILPLLVCKIHKSHVTQNMTPFLLINFHELLLVKNTGSYHVWFSRSQKTTLPFTFFNVWHVKLFALG